MHATLKLWGLVDSFIAVPDAGKPPRVSRKDSFEKIHRDGRFNSVAFGLCYWSRHF